MSDRFQRPGRGAALALLCVLAACAEEKPRVVQRAPAAARPGLLSISHTRLRPSRAQGELAAGEAKELRACAYDASVGELPGGGGILLQVQAPVPTDLLVQLDTADGQRRLVEPEDAFDEDRLARRGLGYVYENGALTRGAATGAVVPRELYIWPGPLAAEGDSRRLDILVRSASLDPRAVGAERESAPLLVPLVGRCPEVTLSLSEKAVKLKQADHVRFFVKLVPQGDGVGAMKTTLAVEGAPKGLKVTIKAPVVSNTDWSDPRDTSVDLEAAPDLKPGAFTLTARVQLGSIEQKAQLQVTVLPRPDDQ